MRGARQELISQNQLASSPCVLLAVVWLRWRVTRGSGSGAAAVVQAQRRPNEQAFPEQKEFPGARLMRTGASRAGDGSAELFHEVGSGVAIVIVIVIGIVVVTSASS